MKSRIDQLCELVANRTTTVTNVKDFLAIEPLDINARHSEHSTRPIAFAVQGGSLAVVKFLIEDLQVTLSDNGNKRNLFIWASENTPDVIQYLTDDEKKLWRGFEDGTPDFHADIVANRNSKIEAQLAADSNLILQANHSGISPLHLAALFLEPGMKKIMMTAGRKVINTSTEAKNSAPHFEALAAGVKDEEPEAAILFMQQSVELTLKAMVASQSTLETGLLRDALKERVRDMYAGYAEYAKEIIDKQEEIALREHVFHFIQKIISQYERYFTQSKEDSRYKTELSYFYNLWMSHTLLLSDGYYEMGKNYRGENMLLAMIYFQKALTLLNDALLMIRNASPLLELANIAAFEKKIATIQTEAEAFSFVKDEVETSDEVKVNIEEIKAKVVKLIAIPIEQRTQEDNDELNNSLFSIARHQMEQGKFHFKEGEACAVSNPGVARDSYGEAISCYSDAKNTLKKIAEKDFHSVKLLIVESHRKLKNCYIQMAVLYFRSADALAHTDHPEWVNILNDYRNAEFFYAHADDTLKKMIKLDGNNKDYVTNRTLLSNKIKELKIRQDFAIELLHGMSLSRHVPHAYASASASASGSSSSSSAAPRFMVYDSGDSDEEEKPSAAAARSREQRPASPTSSSYSLFSLNTDPVSSLGGRAGHAGLQSPRGGRG